MKKVSVFVAPGFEEVECLTTVDLLRRAGVEVSLVAVGAEKEVTGSNGITILADKLFEDMDYDTMDLLFLPGGQPGTNNLKACDKLIKLLHQWNDAGRMLAAICAAPTVFGGMGILDGKKATCYPGCEDGLGKAEFQTDKVVVDGHITTSRGIGTSIPFALCLIEQLEGKEKADTISKGIVYTV